MRFARMIKTMIAGGLACWLGTLAVPESHAQYFNEQKEKYRGIPYEMQQRLEMEDARERDTRVLRDMIGIDWLNEQGEPLVGVVENREMTRAQLARRVNMVLRDLPPLRDPVEALDRQVLLESRMLDEWKEAAILAVHAEHKGATVSDAEVDAAIAEIGETLSEELGTGQAGAPALQMSGIPQSDLRAEVRDGLLVEKYIRSRIDEVYDDRTRLKLFRANPDMFLEPTKVLAMHLFLGTSARVPPNQRKEQEKEFKRWRKRLRKADDVEEVEALITRLGEEAPEMLLGPPQWYAEDEQMFGTLRQLLFTTEVEETSDPVFSGKGWHAVKVLERVEADPQDFEKARPKIDDFLYLNLKEEIYAQVRDHYEVFTDASGLKKWIEKPEESKLEKAMPEAADRDKSLSETTEAEDLEALRKRLKPSNDKEAQFLAPLPPVEAVVPEDGE